MLNSLPLPVALAVLALIDGLSVGTLLIPLFFLIAPGRPNTRRVLLYLSTITGFYLAIGVLFLLGIVNIIHLADDFFSSTAGAWVLLLLGVALFAVGLLIWVADSAKKKKIARLPPDAAEQGGRLLRWRARLLDPRTSGAAVMGVAIAAGLAEIAGMLPYLIGMTMLADAPLAMPSRFLLLAGYCVVMIVPALLLLAVRLASASLVERPLARFAAWMQRTGADTTSWVFCIVGFLIARAAATSLELQLPLIGV